MTEFRKVGYRDGSVDLTALHARPQDAIRAAVAIYPTFMNSTPAVEMKARQLVDAGYAVLIGDFYGPEAPENPEEAFGQIANIFFDMMDVDRNGELNRDELMAWLSPPPMDGEGMHGEGMDGEEGVLRRLDPPPGCTHARVG